MSSSTGVEDSVAQLLVARRSASWGGAGTGVSDNLHFIAKPEIQPCGIRFEPVNNFSEMLDAQIFAHGRKTMFRGEQKVTPSTG
jgi:hypothetical protein